MRLTMRRFNPFDIEECFAADAEIADIVNPSASTPIPLCLPLVWNVSLARTGPAWVCRWDDGELSRWTQATRDALKLPLSDNFLLVADELLGELEEAVAQRLSERRRKAERAKEYGDTAWQLADLLAEVEAQCGQGKRVNGNWWYRCFLHEDKTPSLEVDGENKVFHCFGCGEKGGVYRWRELVRGVSWKDAASR